MNTRSTVNGQVGFDPGTYSRGDGRPDDRPLSGTQQRIASLDIIRGVVMVLMAIDHVRVYSGLPPGGPAPGIFFTRWITNFCAPAFVFLAGTAAYLHGTKLGNKGALARWLAVRGTWLVLLELTVLRFAWTFNVDWAQYNMAGVIWAIGWSMVLLSVLVFLPTAVVGAIGVAIIALHNLMDSLSPSVVTSLGQGSLSWLWKLLYLGGMVSLGRGETAPPLIVLYSLIPWAGVMAAGYAFGVVMRLEPERRRKICLWLGLGATAAFLILRALDVYGDPRRLSASSPLPAAFQFINTTKYPASLLFLLMTLGPTIALIPFAERMRGPVGRVLSIFGRVPLFFYLLHIPLIHIAAIAVSLVTTGHVSPWLFANHPVGPPPPPPGYVWTLGQLYVVWAGVIVILYYACNWYAKLKSRSRNPWLSYL
jgi:uncharacterized membrane protein